MRILKRTDKTNQNQSTQKHPFMFFSTFHVLQITLLRVLYNTKKNSLFHSRSKQRLATSCTNHREDLEQGCLVCPHLPDRRTGAAILKGHRSLVKTPPLLQSLSTSHSSLARSQKPWQPIFSPIPQVIFHG